MHTQWYSVRVRITTEFADHRRLSLLKLPSATEIRGVAQQLVCGGVPVCVCVCARARVHVYFVCYAYHVCAFLKSYVHIDGTVLR